MCDFPTGAQNMDGPTAEDRADIVAILQRIKGTAYMQDSRHKIEAIIAKLTPAPVRIPAPAGIVACPKSATCILDCHHKGGHRASGRCCAMSMSCPACIPAPARETPQEAAFNDRMEQMKECTDNGKAAV